MRIQPIHKKNIIFLPTILMTLMALVVLVILLGWNTSFAGEKADSRVVLIFDTCDIENQQNNLTHQKQSAKMLIRLLSANNELSILNLQQNDNVLLPLALLSVHKNRKKALKIIDDINMGKCGGDIETALTKAYQGLLPVDRSKNVIILMSSGKIVLGEGIKDTKDIEDPKDVKNTRDSNDISLLEQSSKTRITEFLLDKFKKQGINIYTIAIGENADKNLLQQISNQTEGFFFDTSAKQNIAEIYFKILNQIENFQFGTFTGAKFKIDDSVDESILLATTGQLDKKILIKDPKGRKYRQKKSTRKVGWINNKTFSMVKIATPRIGYWRLKDATGKSNGKSNVTDEYPDYKIILKTNLKLLTNSKRTHYFSDEPIYLTAKIQFDTGAINRIPIDLRIKAEVFDEEQKQVERAFFEKEQERSGECFPGRVDRLDDDYFSALINKNSKLKPGTYTVRMTAITENFSRRSEFLIKILEGSWIEIESTTGLFIEKKPLSFNFTLKSDALKPVRLSKKEQLPSNFNLDNPFLLEVTAPDSSAYNLELKQSGNRYFASLENPKPGTYKIKLSAKQSKNSLVCFYMTKDFQFFLKPPAGYSETGFGSYVFAGLVFAAFLLIGGLLFRKYKYPAEDKYLDDDEKIIPDLPPAENYEPEKSKKPEPKTDTKTTKEQAASDSDLDEEFVESPKKSGDPSADEKEAEPVEDEETADDGSDDESAEKDALDEIIDERIPDTEKASEISGIDLGEIESIISKMDEISGSSVSDDDFGGQIGDIDDELSVSIAPDAGGGDGSSSRGSLSGSEYDAIDKALEKMAKLSAMQSSEEKEDKD